MPAADSGRNTVGDVMTAAPNAAASTAAVQWPARHISSGYQQPRHVLSGSIPGTSGRGRHPRSIRSWTTGPEGRGSALVPAGAVVERYRRAYAGVRVLRDLSHRSGADDRGHARVRARRGAAGRTGWNTRAERGGPLVAVHLQ